MTDALARTATGRRADKDLADAVQNVFDPGNEDRAFGCLLMPLTTDRVLGLIESRIRGLERAREPAPVEELRRAWFLYRDSIKTYSAERQALIANPVRPEDIAISEEPAWEHLFNNACYHPSVILGGFARHGT